MKKNVFILTVCFLNSITLKAQQRLSLADVLDSINTTNPELKMYDYEILSMDEAAKGARSWMPPEFGTGLWMAPYKPSLWKKSEDGMNGMGQYMIAGQQMFPNPKKQNAEVAYMQAISSVEKEKKNFSLNQLYAEAKKNYYDWVIIQKKLRVVDQNERLLNFMIQSAELRYKNGLEKINAYYKAKAALGNLEKMKIMLQNEVLQKRIVLNTLMARDKLTDFSIDTSYLIKDYSGYLFDSSQLLNARSDLKAVDKAIQLNWLIGLSI